MATKSSAPQQKPGMSRPSQAYSPKSRGDCVDPSIKDYKNIPCSDGGLQAIHGPTDPEEGTAC